MNKHQLLIGLAILIVAFTSSCDNGDSSQDEEGCEGPLCPYVGNWQLAEVSVDGDEIDADQSAYRLNLMKPESDPNEAPFTRIDASGQIGSGIWRVENNNDVIVLSGDGDDEQYIIEDSGSGHLILVLNRADHKPGPSQIRYVFNK